MEKRKSRKTMEEKMSDEEILEAMEQAVKIHFMA